MVWKAIALVALGCAALGAILYIDRIPSHRLMSLLGISVTVSDSNDAVEKKQNTPPPDADSGTAVLGSVAIQTFDGPTLMRQGAGVSVSADGLILTTTAVAPYGSGSFIYQVALSGGRLLRARRIVSNPLVGLVLLKVEANDLNAVLFDQEVSLQAGMQLEVISSQLAWSRLTVVRLPVWVVWSDEDHTATALSLDHTYGSAMSGARIVNNRGRSVGMLRWTGQPILIRAAQINDFLEQYLNGIHR